MTKSGSIAQKEAHELQAVLSADSEQVQLVDVRSALEFESERIDQAINIPVDELGARGGELKRDRPIALVCRSGMRAARAAETLASFGYETVVLTGGLLAWKKRGFAVKQGKKSISLERQVQLTIGLILLLSVAAGFTVSNLFLLVPAFIGAGLTFAGLSGTCGLALLIARAPWNKAPGDAAAKAGRKQ